VKTHPADTSSAVLETAGGVFGYSTTTAAQQQFPLSKVILIILLGFELHPMPSVGSPPPPPVLLAFKGPQQLAGCIWQIGIRTVTMAIKAYLHIFPPLPHLPHKIYLQPSQFCLHFPCKPKKKRTAKCTGSKNLVYLAPVVGL